MGNHKQMLADFYLKLMTVPADDSFRIANPRLYIAVSFALAALLEEDVDTVQRIFEKMAQEDSK